jgi:molecular chaperone DnaJ
MLKDLSPGQNNKELKRFYRKMLKALHPDLGGDKEEFLKFLAWYADQHAKDKSFEAEVVKRLPSQGNYVYRCEEFTLEEILTLKQKTLVLPIDKKCPDCEGTGYDRFKSQVCGNCLGAGLIETLSSRSEDKVYVPCPFCGGRGRVQRVHCSTCLGRGTIRDELREVIDLPLGLEEGDYLYLPKDRFNLPQDVYVEVVIKDHPNFKRNGKDLILEHSVSLWELLLSDFIEVPTLEGLERLATSDLRTSQGIVLKSRGLYYYERGDLKRGNLIVKLKVIYPIDLPLEVKECLSLAYETYKRLHQGG